MDSQIWLLLRTVMPNVAKLGQTQYGFQAHAALLPANWQWLHAYFFVWYENDFIVNESDHECNCIFLAGQIC